LPEWNEDVSWASFEGEVEPGAQFIWKAGPGKIRSTLQYVERPRLVVWKGKTIGIKAVHLWRIEPPDGGTVVTTEESWEGFVARLFHGWIQQMLQRSIDAGLVYLRGEAERRAGF
jgi:hypothetical protein